MRHLGFAAAALLVLLPTPAVSAASWQPATATTVSAGVNSRSTFVIQAYVTLPQSCDAARIVTYAVTTGLNRSFIVVQQAPSSTCKGTTMYKCTVVSPSFSLPIQHKFDVHSKGKTWVVHLAMQAPTPTEPICAKR
jgi:hypothetical protein